jgi:SAM-dependent methyltransferase
VTALGLDNHAITRCPECNSVDILGDPLDSSPTDDMVDSYVEAGAGISTIAEAFDLIDKSKVERFLDVGCNYGFALDVARHEFGWDVTGIEPSHAASRGSAELGVAILPVYLTEETPGLGTFDLVLASEVVEHVPDPVPFLRAIRSVLSPDGVVLLTTPAAEVITPDHPTSAALAALSPGYHSFVSSATGLAILLSGPDSPTLAFLAAMAHSLLSRASTRLPNLRGRAPRSMYLPMSRGGRGNPRAEAHCGPRWQRGRFGSR